MFFIYFYKLFFNSILYRLLFVLNNTEENNRFSGNHPGCFIAGRRYPIRDLAMASGFLPGFSSPGINRYLGHRGGHGIEDFVESRHYRRKSTINEIDQSGTE